MSAESDENELLGRVLRRYIADEDEEYTNYLDCEGSGPICIDGWVKVEPDELALIRRLDAEARARDV